MRATELKIGYLGQEFAVTPSNTIRQELEKSFTNLVETQSALNMVHNKLENAEGSELK